MHFSEFADHLRNLSWIGSFIEEVDASDAGALQAAAERSRESDINIWFVRHPMWAAFKGARVIWAIFESDTLPQDYIKSLQDLADVIWSPSRWGRDVLTASGIDPSRIDVVPEGVNPNLFHPFLRLPMAQTPRPFRFLAVGKFEERKAYPQLLEAFASVFRNDPQVQLVLKADFFVQPEPAQRALQALVDSMDLRNVRMVWGALPTNELLGLYSMCDAMVFPSRAEGWGLPLIEAIASGLPAVSTVYSGHSEFLECIADKFIPIGHETEPIADPGYLRFWPGLVGSEARWAAPRVDSISQGMKAVYESSGHWQTLALEASHTIRQQFSWRAAADKAYESLTRRGLYEPLIGLG